ncbi:MAG: hypothetical protein ABIH65_01115 [Nanoarchaeota archaeon]
MKNLEKRKSNEDTEQFSGALSAHCEKCKTDRLFSYFGKQSNSLNIPTRFNPLGEDILLYNCSDCGSTRDSNTLTEKRIISEEDFEKLSDSEIALFYTFHINHPCSVNVNNKDVNIRAIYINEAKRILPKLSNPFAKSFLESVIRNYIPESEFIQ